MARTKQTARKMSPKSSPKKSKASPKRSPKSKASPKKTKSPKKSPKSKASPKKTKSPKKSPVKKSSPKKSPRVKGVSRTNLESITDPALKRLARVGGVVRIASDVYPEIRNIIAKDLNDLMKAAVHYAEHDRRKTVSFNDIKMAYEKITRKKFYGTPPTDMCKKHQRVVSSKRKANSAKIAISEIKHYQSQSGACFFIPQAAFNRLAKEAMHNHEKNFKIGKEAIGAAHYLVEQHVVSVYEDAVLAAIAAKRRGIRVSDVKLIMKIRRE